MENVLVTGGAGFIGSFVAENLIKQGKSVTVLDDLSVGKREYVPREAEFVKGSITDDALVGKLVSKCDEIYHLAVVALPVSLKDPIAAHDTNATGTIKLLEAARKHDARFIYISSSEVYGTSQSQIMSETHQLEPRTPYAASKLAGEVYAMSYYRTFGLPVVVIRPFNSFGPHHREDSYACVITRFILDAMAGKPLKIFGDGEQSRDYIFVKDAANGIVSCGKNANDGDIINIGSGNDLKINYIASAILKKMNSKSEIIHVADRPGDVRRLCADISKARKLGFKPGYTFEKGLDEYLRWIRENKNG